MSGVSAMDADLPGPRWEGVVVFGAANNWDSVKLADQHLAERLCAYAPVLYVDPPMSHLTPRKRPDLAASMQGPRLRLINPRLARLTTIMPPKGQHRLASEVTRLWINRQVQRSVGRLSKSVRAVIVGRPDWDLLGRLGEEVSIYWAQDDFVSGAAIMGLDPALVARSEERAAARADAIVVSSPHVRDQWESKGKKPVLIPFGCDSEAFARRGSESRPVSLPAVADLAGRPVAGFVGHINSRIDLTLLEAVVAGGSTLLLVGPLDPAFEPERVQRLLDRDGVTWVGPVPFDGLPAYLGAIEVGVVPYTTSGFNLGSFPLKTMEYLSAGLPVVATDLPSTRWFDTELIRIADDPADFAGAVAELAPTRFDADLVAQRQAFARRHDWEERARSFVDLIAELAGRERQVLPTE